VTEQETPLESAYIEFNSDCELGRSVRWYGGAQVNLFVAVHEGVNVEVNVSSRAEWWSVKPTEAEVADFAEELFADEDIWYG
jgi:hypothetical protein